MRIFKRTAPGRERAELGPGDELRRTVSSVVVVGDTGGSGRTQADRRAQLLRVVAEGLVLEDRAEDLLMDIRDREPLAEMARLGGPLARRFLQLARSARPRPWTRTWRDSARPPAWCWITTDE